ncbi:MAG: hypothetical protein K2L98_03515 [Bacilli bacterium]|nr:hypothetical protein [Bacilli bacterium]
MEERVFYVELDNSIKAVKVSDINMLAHKALSLEPEREITEALGYMAALATYYQDNDDDLKETYMNLVSSSNGKVFLCSTISLSLLETAFRDNGIGEQDINVYNKVIADHQRQLNFNQQKYSDQVGNNKTRTSI